jgi:hypothetical protein
MALARRTAEAIASDHSRSTTEAGAETAAAAT